MDINDLVKLLPPDYEEACYETKAMIRKRTIKTPFDLLTFRRLRNAKSRINTAFFCY
mgnify:CR=1 FL=1